MDILEKPKKLNEDEINEALGRLFWGKNWKKFSWSRLMRYLMKKEGEVRNG